MHDGLAGQRAVGLRDRRVDHGEDVGHPLVRRRQGDGLSGIRLAVLTIDAHRLAVSAIRVGRCIVAHAPSPAPQRVESAGGQRPVGFFAGDAPSRAQHGVGAGELVGRGADVHAGIVENEILQMDEFALQPQSGAGVGEVRSADPPVADWALGQPLVEARERIFSRCKWAGNLAPGQRIWDLVAGMQDLDNLNGNRSNGSYHGVRFRHSDAFSRVVLTIDNYPLSIVLDLTS
ncbi:hypothetical protein BN961_03884 [Afipia felis]|uniref:Uncharacterized protein n=1 Tax=Afipia felis TaxID=1035 RepID=A0A090MW93_AFIFE|nr:hypothetical protein BN961_03884 [Afipia felis]